MMHQPVDPQDHNPFDTTWPEAFEGYTTLDPETIRARENEMAEDKAATYALTIADGWVTMLPLDGGLPITEDLLPGTPWENEWC